MTNLRKLAQKNQISAGAAENKPRALIFRRSTRQRDALPSKIIAYDFETTRIKAGETPTPLYITAYGENPRICYESAVSDNVQLCLILTNNFLTPENVGAKFVAWNGNRFDAFILAIALLLSDDYIIRPYLTKSKALRGLRVTARVMPEWCLGKRLPSWEFLDGLAMLGLVGVSLEKFLLNFAPEHSKLIGVIDFEREEFNADNPAHRKYAMRDSVGLYHGMIAAQGIMLEYFNQPLTVTMGGACIKIFQSYIPEGIDIIPLKPEADSVLRLYAMRGGYCHLVRPYKGLVWKYDINQAYAAAMRDADMPASFAVHSQSSVPRNAKVYIARINARKLSNKIPFYYRSRIGTRVVSVFGLETIIEAWLTSIEIEQLRAEHWSIEVLESWAWHASFRMAEFVDRLEFVRTTCAGGPSGPIGTVIKAVGNHSYGKTVEILEPVEYVMAKERPDNFYPYYPDGSVDPLDFVYFRFLEEQKSKVYHHPQIGAFITSHVRMLVRRAALLSPKTWLYADTDCVVFSSDVTNLLDIDSKRYGAWKIEDAGVDYSLIAKKVYVQNIASDDTSAAPTGKKSAKGLNVHSLSVSDFAEWFDGRPPTQNQRQMVRFDKVISGSSMFRTQTRRGTSVQPPTAKG